MMFDVAAVFAPALGQIVCGDAYRVLRAGPVLMIALADGLGHGPHAELAAARFCDVVEANASMSLDGILGIADRELKPTRGAAGAILRLDKARGRVEFCGVGNVSIHAFGRSALSAVSTPGILGRRSRTIRAFEAILSRGDGFVLFTDGIESRAAWAKDLSGSAAQFADRVMNSHRKAHDDATCVVVRYGADGV